ncbi:hypothetical protein SAMN02745116_00542 [Pilibacter termitis]|jgi:hypothetical protein|uniref:Uncharacterized protein n=1 Tax=Pilibacter termitis TaxID=263852 RepID=A0A1T4L594_9ENTE|nr:hypothetical protein [Pilibacter termitis]SJZ49690.1 hypothetical protein SAMN02745116_00542 [Pilibacter termitis]
MLILFFIHQIVKMSQHQIFELVEQVQASRMRAGYGKKAQRN